MSNYLEQLLNLSYVLPELESSLGDVYIKSIVIKVWERNGYDAMMHFTGKDPQKSCKGVRGKGVGNLRRHLQKLHFKTCFFLPSSFHPHSSSLLNMSLHCFSPLTFSPSLQEGKSKVSQTVCSQLLRAVKFVPQTDEIF
jgi:hypothetical protein